MAAAKRKPKPRTRQKVIPPESMTQTQAAEFCRVSVRQFQKYGLEPVGRKGRCAYYSRDQLIDWIEKRAQRKGYEAGLRDGKATVPEDAADLQRARDQAELKWTEERAEGQRLRNAELRRELAPVEMLTWALSDLASQITPLLTPIPGEIKRRIPKITNSELHVMREVIANALNLVAEVRLDFDAYEPDGEQAGD